jgi:hypothetical protein
MPPGTFFNHDAVIAIRHLSYFISVSREEPLPDERTNVVYVGGTGALPNVLVSVPCGVPLPQPVIDGINALSSDDPLLA